MITETERRKAIQQSIEAAKPTWFTRLVDGALEPFAPGVVARRIQNRQELGYRRAMLAYAAQNPSFARDHTYEPLMTEEAYLPGYARFQIITDARDLYRNSPIIRAGVNGLARRSVATGIHPEFMTSDPDWNAEAGEQWAGWAETCEIRGNLSMDGMARQIIRSIYYDGDLGVLYLDEDGDLRLKAIEADLIAQDMRVSINIDTVNPIGGVVLDWKTGRALGYYVGERGIGGIVQNSQIISAENMLLLFRPQRVDQVRGIPLLAPVITTARDLDFYLEATRIQANIAATYGVVVKRDSPGLFQMANTTENTGSDGKTYRTMQMPTGKMVWLAPGESIESFKPDVPGPIFDQFARFLVRMVAIGMGTTYEMLMQDFSNMSFSSSRTNLLDATLTMQEWQRFLVKKFYRPTFARWVAKRMHSGQLAFNAEAYNRVAWHLPAELGVDPQKNAASDVQLLSAGLETYENLLQQAGKGSARDWLRKKADEAAYIAGLAKERGIPAEMISSTLQPGVSVSSDEAAPAGEPVNGDLPAEGTLAVHPTTGERIRYLNGEWRHVDA